jgi:hypothetical protein
MTILPVVLVLTGRPVAAGVSDADGVAIALVYIMLTVGVGVVAVLVLPSHTAASEVIGRGAALSGATEPLPGSSCAVPRAIENRWR